MWSIQICNLNAWHHKFANVGKGQTDLKKLYGGGFKDVKGAPSSKLQKVTKMMVNAPHPVSTWSTTTQKVEGLVWTMERVWLGPEVSLSLHDLEWPNDGQNSHFQYAHWSPSDINNNHTRASSYHKDSKISNNFPSNVELRARSSSEHDMTPLVTVERCDLRHRSPLNHY